MLVRSLRRWVPFVVVLGCSAPPLPETPQVAPTETGAPGAAPAETGPHGAPPAGSARPDGADDKAPPAPAAPTAAAARRKPTYPETFCPSGTIADGALGATQCHCCEPFGIPCPNSSIKAPKPGDQCTVFGSENNSCLWKCD